MTKSDQNLCPRCGKQRITGKKHFEMVGKIKVSVVDTICPDKKCQKELEQDTAAKKKKREDMQEKRKNNAKSHRVDIRL